MPEPIYVPVFSKFTLQEMLDHAPSPWIGLLGFLLSRMNLIQTDQGNPAPNPVSEDLTAFEAIPEAFQPGVKQAVGFFEGQGFKLLSHMHNPRFPNVSGAYLLHQNHQWVAFVAVVKDPGPQGKGFREVYSLLGFTADGQCYSVTTAPFMQVPHIQRRFARRATPQRVLSLFQRHVQGKTLRTLQGLPEVLEVLDDMSMRSHRVLVTRGAKKAVVPKEPQEPESLDPEPAKLDSTEIGKE